MIFFCFQEYGFEDNKKSANLFESVIGKVIKMIKDSMKRFQSVISTFKDNSVKDIFNDLVESVDTMPDKVGHIPIVQYSNTALLTLYL